jgi:chemotaxis protein methyltransferase CheR
MAEEDPSTMSPSTPTPTPTPTSTSSARPARISDFDIELKLLLEAIYLKYQHDFRHYAMTSLRRRLSQALEEFGLTTLSQLQDRIMRNGADFSRLFQYLTVQVSDMFRDPAYFMALRQHVMPVLRTYPSVKVWVAGCSTGEEAYSLAILLREEGLLAKTLIYATDINPRSLLKAAAGVYAVERIAGFTANHHRSGARASLSEYYTAAYGGAVFDRSLRDHIVFSDHSLATDSVFAEVQLVSCRNVLIYFDRVLQDRAFGLFQEALCHSGFLGIGSKESTRFSAHAAAFTEFVREQRIFQKRAAS